MIGKILEQSRLREYEAVQVANPKYKYHYNSIKMSEKRLLGINHKYINAYNAT